MNELLSLLVQLQKADIVIQNYESMIKTIPNNVDDWRKRYKIQQDELAQMQHQAEEFNKEFRYEERKLQVLEDNLSKFQAKIYAVKTQKEMISLDHEIAKSREEKSQTEDNLLILMDNIEKLTNQIVAKKEILASELIELQSAETDCNERLNIAEQNLNRNKEKRKELTTKIPRQDLERYEKLRANKNNLAVVAVKNGICQGCFVTLPPQEINEVKSSSTLVTCERCIRILYCEDNKE